MNQSTTTKPASLDDNSDADSTSPARAKHPLVSADAMLGAAAGAAIGVLAAGPPGAAAGAVIGAFVGTAAGIASERGAAQTERENEELDKDIGVIGGAIGAASPDQPPARIGAFSRGSMGVGSGAHAEVASGPMQSIDDE